jgi:hypothetical protein
VDLASSAEEKPLKRGFFDGPKPNVGASSGSKKADAMVELKGKKDRIGASGKTIPGRKSSYS